MDIVKYKTMLSNRIVEPIVAYMQEWEEDCSFTAKDVHKCEAILNQYLDSLALLSGAADKDIMKCVKKAVVALNKLNEKTDYTLLETDERENICELIQRSAVECGLQNPEEDITEEWREW